MKSTRFILLTLCFLILFALSCSKTDTAPTTPPNPGGTCSTATPGTLFKEVKTLLANNCVSCHNPNGQMPNVDFRDNCVIQTKAAQIKERAVDLGTMPPSGPLSKADKDKITTWVAAGGKVTD